MVPAERDPLTTLRELIALCTAETFKFLLEPDKADWLVGQIIYGLPLPPHAARPLARYVVKLVAQAADAQTQAGGGWAVRKAAQLAAALLRRVPYSQLVCDAIAVRLRKLNADALAREEAERAVTEAGYKVDPKAAQRLSLDLRAGLRQLQEIAELRDLLQGIEASIESEHRGLRDYLSEALNLQPPLNLPIVADDHEARFVFRAQRVPFFGRARELAALRAFLDHEASFRWWLVAGPAGTGKSRLALQFCLRGPNCWRAGFLHDDTSFDRFEDWQPFEPTLLVVDYAARDPKRVGRWLRQLAARETSDRPLQAPVRMLFLERAKDEDWWRELVGADRHGPRQCFHAERAGEPPLVLAESAAERGEIAWHTIESLFRADGRTPPDRRATMAALTRINDRVPPLDAAFAADALLAGRDIRGWDRTRLIEDVIDRSRERRWRPAAARLGVDLARHELLLRLATVAQGLPLSVLEAPPVGLRLPTRDPEHEYGFCAPLYEVMAPGVIGKAGGAVLSPLEPDILGEVFVLTPSEQLRADPTMHQRQLHGLAKAAWSLAAPSNVFAFLDRAAADWFPSQDLVALLRPPETTEEQAAGWCRVAVNVLARAGRPERMAEAGSVLLNIRRVASQWPSNIEISRLLAVAVYNLMLQFMNFGRLDQAGIGLKELCDVANRYTNRIDIAEILAQSIVNYCGGMSQIVMLKGAAECVAELESANSCVDELRSIARRWPDQAGIATALAQGLLNYGLALVAAERLDVAGECLNELRDLSERWPQAADIYEAREKLERFINSDAED